MGHDGLTVVVQVGAGTVRGNEVDMADVFVCFNKDSRVAFWGRGIEVVFDNVYFVSLGLRQSDVHHDVGDVLCGIAGVVHGVKSASRGFLVEGEIESSMISRLDDDIEKDLHGERSLLNTLCLLFYSYFSLYLFSSKKSQSASPLFEVISVSKPIRTKA